jgi:antitoxin (DNA-binding transcriptional repressor) of toxin-antitoxin stability system
MEVPICWASSGDTVTTTDAVSLVARLVALLRKRAERMLAPVAKKTESKSFSKRASLLSW